MFFSDIVQPPTLSQASPLIMCTTTDLLYKLELSLGVTTSCTTSKRSSAAADNDLVVQSKRRRTIKKSVRFCEEMNTTQLRSLSDSDFKAAWMQLGDYQAIRGHVRNTLVAIKKGKIHEVDNNQHCIQGLERHIDALLFRQGRSKQQRIVQGVLNEQRVQRASGITDPPTLNGLSMILTRDCRFSALQRGEIHAAITYY